MKKIKDKLKQFNIKDPKYHEKTKHTDIKYNFVMDMVARKKMNILFQGNEMIQ